MIDIYQYLDYRFFFQDYLKLLKESHPQLSQRCIALRTGLDPSFLTKVMKSKRKLSLEQAMNLAKFFKLSKWQKDYLELLIGYDHAQSDIERETYRKKIHLKQSLKIVTIDNKQIEFYQKWYNTVVRELMYIIPFADHESISQLVIPKVSPQEIKQSIELLEDLKILKKENDNKYCLSSPFITADTNVPAATIHAFQKQMIELAKESLTMDKDSREVSTLTLSLSNAGFNKVKEMIIELRKQLIEIAQNDLQVPAGVFQVNFQAFPIALMKRNHL